LLPRFRNVVTAVLGAFILVWQTVLEEQAQAVLVGAALVLLGVPTSDEFGRWLEKMMARRNGKNGEAKA
jgi:hypothetical protein